MKSFYLLTFLFLSNILYSDIVYLKNGCKIEGKVTEEGNNIILKTKNASVTFSKSEILKIEKCPTKWELYEEKSKKIKKGDIQGHLELAKWCNEQKLREEYRKELLKVIDIDPEHEEARRLLGHIKYENRWRTYDEMMTLKGFVKFRGKWYTPEQIEQIKEKEETQKFVKRINSIVNKFTSQDPTVRESAYQELLKIAEEEEMPELAEWADEVKKAYDEAWAKIEEELKKYEKKRGKMIRANLRSSLRRFDTGAGTIEAPEGWSFDY